MANIQIFRVIQWVAILGPTVRSLVVRPQPSITSTATLDVASVPGCDRISTLPSGEYCPAPGVLVTFGQASLAPVSDENTSTSSSADLSSGEVSSNTSSNGDGVSEHTSSHLTRLPGYEITVHSQLSVSRPSAIKRWTSPAIETPARQAADPHPKAHVASQLHSLKHERVS